jgi:hypothetical protein
MNLKFDEEQKRFIENYSEEQFVEFYPTYLKLVNKYSTELVDLFICEFDDDPSYLLKFEDMYEGQFETGQDFAWHWVNEICEETKNIPSWVTIDYEDIWVNKLKGDYEEIDCYGESTFGHIFNRKDFPKYDN